MSETSEQILDIAEELMRQGGFHAFSFQDIADRIGIKKASIYYHHPAKAALGREVIARYRRRFREIAAATEAAEIGYAEALEAYLSPIVLIAESEAGVCLCGVLGGEYLALPEEMRAEVAAFYQENQAWIAQLLEKGRAAGAFAFEGAPEDMAKLGFSALEGAMLIARATGDPNQFKTVIDTVRRLLSPRQPGV